MLKTYDPKDYVVYFAGTVFDRGIVSVKVSADTPLYGDPTVGIDGESTRNRSNNKNYTCELTLMASSTANKALSDIFNVGRNMPNATDVGAFAISHVFGGDAVASTHAYIDADPGIQIGAEVAEYTWKLRLIDAQIKYAGLPTI